MPRIYVQLCINVKKRVMMQYYTWPRPKPSGDIPSEAAQACVLGNGKRVRLLHGALLLAAGIRDNFFMLRHSTGPQTCPVPMLIFN